jgi:hypothetical protein
MANRTFEKSHKVSASGLGVQRHLLGFDTDHHAADARRGHVCHDIEPQSSTSLGTRGQLPSLAVSNDASPTGWSQNWSHLLANAANHSRITTSKALPSLPWAQGVAGSNPVAPTTSAGPAFASRARFTREAPAGLAVARLLNQSRAKAGRIPPPRPFFEFLGSAG